MVTSHALEKELQPFTVCQFEPLSEYCQKLFRNYREIRVRVLGWLKESSAKRASTVKKFRRSKTLRTGDEVVVRDPRQRKAGGRTPYKQPYTEPALVLEVHGNKCSLEGHDGTILKDIQSGDVMQVPENARNLEKEPLEFLDEGESFTLDIKMSGAHQVSCLKIKERVSRSRPKPLVTPANECRLGNLTESRQETL